MSIYIALLRGINVGGKRLKMAELRDLFTTLGLSHPKTLLASGNIAFHSTTTDPQHLVNLIEMGMIERFGFDAKIILRTPAAIQTVIDRHPFTTAQLADPQKLLVMFLRSAPSAAAVAAFQANFNGPEQVQFAGETLYSHYPEGMGRSKLDTKALEKALGVVATGRNWNTVNKLLGLAESIA